MRAAARIVTLAALLAACSSTVKSSPRIARGDLDGSERTRHRVLVAEGDSAWEQRADRAKLDGAIDAWRRAVDIKPDDHQSYAKLARAEFLLADGWLAFDGSEQAYLAAHQRGMRHAELGMRALSPSFEQKRVDGAAVDRAATELGGSQAIPLMYWYAANLSRWANARGFSSVLENKDVALALVLRVQDLDADYFHGAPDRYLGAFYAVAPAFAGGDLERSRRHFDRSLALAPEYLLTHVLIAELYATRARDRELFQQSLAAVRQAGPGAGNGALAAENDVARRKAEALAAREDQLF